MERTVALIGNPNTGKSTLFTALTGVHSRTGNYPGVTVEKKLGWFEFESQRIRLVDLPGTYSLSPRTIDEMVSVDVLLGRQVDLGPIDAVVCIADASNLERNLYLVSQVLDLGLPAVLVLNMWDVATERGITINVPELEKRLGIAVIPCEAHRRKEIDRVRSAIIAVSGNQTVLPVTASTSNESTDDCPTRPNLFPPVFRETAIRLQSVFEQAGQQKHSNFLFERLLLDVGGQLEVELTKPQPDKLLAQVKQAREELQAAGCRVPVIEAKVRYAWARKILSGVMTVPTKRTVTWTDRFDHVLTHKVAGPIIFCIIMFGAFQLISRFAQPLMDYCELGQKSVADFVGSLLPFGALRSLIVDGVLAGMGALLVFLPQICVLILFIAILEDCGYMARAAFLMDKLMTKVGLSGKSFVPLMSSFACAIPGIMATRTIENRRDRMVTILVAPLMSCSARAPVYWLMVAAFFPPVTWAGGWISLHGIMLFVMTFFGTVVAIPVAWVFKRTLFKGETPPFVMELPSYKWPSIRIVLYRVYDRACDFVGNAGTLIVATSILIWAASYFPGDHTKEHQILVKIQQAHQVPVPDYNAEAIQELIESKNQISEDLLVNSYLGRFGKLIEPSVKPLGWDWRIGVGVLASFPAREVIVATLGTIYRLGGEQDENSEGLQDALKSAQWPDGRPVYTLAVAMSLMVFVALCAQCSSTLVVIRRETNHWGWAVFTFIYMTVLAYIAALVAYNVTSLFA